MQEGSCSLLLMLAQEQQQNQKQVEPLPVLPPLWGLVCASHPALPAAAEHALQPEHPSDRRADVHPAGSPSRFRAAGSEGNVSCGGQ